MLIDEIATTPRGLHPLRAVSIAPHFQDAVRPAEGGVFFGDFVRVEWPAAAADDVGDAAIAFPMHDAKGIGVTTHRAAARIRESLVDDPGLRRQFEWTAEIDSMIDHRIVEEAREIGPEF